MVALIAAQGHLPLDTPTTTPPDSVPQPLKELIQACLVAEPDERPSVADALQVCVGETEPLAETTLIAGSVCVCVLMRVC